METPDQGVGHQKRMRLKKMSLPFDDAVIALHFVN
jgi:hypothetical protein